MNNYPHKRTTTRKTIKISLLGLAVFITAAIVATFLHQSASSSPELSTALGGKLGAIGSEVQIRINDRGAPDDLPAAPAVAPPHEESALTEQDGILSNDVTVFDTISPAVINLDPGLLQALRDAATDAASDDIAIYVTSGWRSPAYQDQLLQEAVTEYGSEQEAARWVATANTSAHVSGNAVDVGQYDAIAWLSQHGAAYGLCQIYGNESWHFELRPQAISNGCPAMYDDPTQDPRMQQ